MKDTNTTGKEGERIAAKYLKKNGYKIIAANFENKKGYRLGEIDIVAKERKTEELVFVEVKTRKAGSSNNSIILPEEAINRKKLFRLGRIIETFIRNTSIPYTSYRLDAVSVLIYQDKKAQVRHLKSIFL